MIRVVVVEDEPIAARAHAAYLERLEGFEVVGNAPSCAQAVRVIAREQPDLVLLDMRLPDGHGLELLHRLRASGQLCDVIAVTSVREVEVVRRSLALGITHYLIKPFTFDLFRAKLANYRAYHGQLGRTGQASPERVAQAEVDQLFDLRASAGASSLPKGISPQTLQAVSTLLGGSDEALSATEVAAALGTSRVTARRYLEHLAGTGLAERRERYGHAGRPEVEYLRQPR
ncbi:response regulator [Luteococcus sp. H138]|uniref:response regulator n=1 Tax=unclassified Luteococcus TaxID=2639923 RepID=UPI00313F0C38